MGATMGSSAGGGLAGAGSTWFLAASVTRPTKNWSGCLWDPDSWARLFVHLPHPGAQFVQALGNVARRHMQLEFPASVQLAGQ